MPRETGNLRTPTGSAAHRLELIANTAGLDIECGQHQVRVSNVPVFRETAAGLAQAVRLRIAATPEPADLTVRIGSEESWIDQVTVRTDVTQTEFLFVPEVEAQVDYSVELICGHDTVGTATFTACPQRKWTIHLVHHSHYDIGYTDPQAMVLESQLTFIDDALELAAATDDWPEDARFRWTIEVNWPLKQWLRTRPQSARDDLVLRIREGRFEVNALPFSMHTEAYSFDELARQLDFAQELRDTLGISITTAMQTDVPGSTIGLATLLTDAGIRFLAVAHNYAGRSIPHLLDGQDLSRPFYWQAPDGEKVLVWYTDTLHGSAYMEAMSVGFGDGYDDVLMGLPEYLNALAQRNYPYGSGESWLSGSLLGVESTRDGYPFDLLHLRVQGAYGDNAPPSILASEIVREWNETWAYPRLITSTNTSFLAETEARMGNHLETFEGDWTDWWADGIGSSAAMLAKNRASQSGIRTAQTLNALAGAAGGDSSDSDLDVTAAYEEMALFDEHTWGAADPWGKDLDSTGSGEHQWMRKAGFALSAEERVGLLLRGGVERLASLAVGTTRPAEGESLAVFNPNSWPRTDLVRLFVPSHAWPATGARLIEADSGQLVPFVVEPQMHDRHRPAGVWLRFLASDVPPIGYVRYQLLPAESTGTAGELDRSGSLFANDHFSVALDLDRGSLASIVDRSGQRELVNDSAPYGFNAYIHDRYTSGTGFNHLSSKMGRAQPWMLGARGTGEYGLITARTSNDVFDQVTYRQSAQGADWIETTLTLPRGVPRIHISNRLIKPTKMEKESVFFAFPFAGYDPEITVEVTGGTVGPRSPHVPGSARHFRAIRHWATIESPDTAPIAWATTQAPLVQIGNIHLPYAPFPTTIPVHQASSGTIYSWALNNIWDTNFPPQQGGELCFDYVVAIGNDNAVSNLGRDTGASASQPLVGLRARASSTGLDLPDRGSFVTVDDPRVEVTHLSANGDGNLTVHLESHADLAVNTQVTFSGFSISGALVTNFVGANAEALDLVDGGVTIQMNAGELKRVRLQLGEG